jgi:Bacterial extracellular solute-binding proteins, family 5 Middle
MPATHPADTVTVVVFDKIDLAHAPWGQNREERFVFSHLYETLVTIDCHGVVQPGLAKSWKPGSDGWLVELRDGAKFWDESPVTARDVVESFGPALHGGIAIESVDVIDERHVLVHGHRGPPDIKLLAFPITAVRKDSVTPGYPMGTGAWQIDDGTPVAEAIAISPVLVHGPVVRFVRANPSDAKDLVSGQADAMITDDPAVIDYARTKPQVTLAPLPWDAVYAVLALSRLTLFIDECRMVSILPADLCERLAHDAVHVDAKGSSDLFYESRRAASRQPETVRDKRLTRVATESRVVYDKSDPTARALAERLVALAVTDTASSSDARSLALALPGIDRRKPRSAGLAASELDEHLRNPTEFAYVLRFSWNTDYPLVAQELFKRAPWAFDPYLPLYDMIVPLVETRAHFIVMSDRVAFSDDGAGNVRIFTNPAPRR